jgi:small neutral amino acid transporter SnatA (MarC family)
MVLCLVSGYIAFDLLKKYKEEKNKKLLFGVAFFVLIVVAFLAYFGSKFLN